MVRTMRSAGQTLLEMIGDLLDVAKIESGTMPCGRRRSICTSCCDGAGAAASQARDKGLDLRSTIDPHVPHRLHGAARSLQQILVNLTGNAIKFTDVGHVTIAVAAEAVEPQRVMLRIEVRGYRDRHPAEAQERIFERFAQVDESPPGVTAAPGSGSRSRASWTT